MRRSDFRICKNEDADQISFRCEVEYPVIIRILQVSNYLLWFVTNLLKPSLSYFFSSSSAKPHGPASIRLHEMSQVFHN